MPEPAGLQTPALRGLGAYMAAHNRLGHHGERLVTERLAIIGEIEASPCADVRVGGVDIEVKTATRLSVLSTSRWAPWRSRGIHDTRMLQRGRPGVLRYPGSIAGKA